VEGGWSRKTKREKDVCEVLRVLINHISLFLPAFLVLSGFLSGSKKKTERERQSEREGRGGEW